MKEIVSKLERETGMIFHNPKDAPTTREGFDKIASDISKYHRVMYDFRVKFLQDNGYAVTRKNLIDNSLSTKPKEENDG